MGLLGSGFQGSRTFRGLEFSKGGSSHLIRSAEKLAASGRFDFAIEQLNVAQQLDPENKYIQAIIDRIRVMQNSPQDGNATIANLLDTPNKGPLAITVGPEFANGVKSLDDDQPLTPDAIHTKIRFLTNMANQYLESGSSEKAFHSLMKAYLLDPLSPYVVAAEKTVLPAWEILKTDKHIIVAAESSASQPAPVQMLNSTLDKEFQTMAPSPFNDINSPSLPRPVRSMDSSTDEQLRMEMLRQQKEHERVEKERVIWREASKPPKIFGEDDPATFPAPPREEQQQPRAHSGGLFSRLRLGKFLE